jgi:Putative zinc-finger
MILWGCASVRRRLPAFHDRELPIHDLITIESHVAGCPACAGELQELRSIGDALRVTSAPGPVDNWTGLRSGVVSRMRAEAQESWTARTERMFDDLHLIWIGLAATAATFLCGAVALSAVQFASPERNDSLAAVISVISAPSGSDLNPVLADNRFLQFPSVPGSGPIEAMLAQPVSRDELTLALSAVVTREGRVAGLSVLNREQQPHNLEAILDVLSRSRLEPGRRGTLPVAMNLVWLVAHTTVKAKAPPRSI